MGGCNSEILTLAEGSCLRWYPQLGWGYLDCVGQKTDYYDEYAALAETDMAKALNAIRVETVRGHTDGIILDVGIGDGAFCRAHGNACGYDVDPDAVEWLKDRCLYVDPYEHGIHGSPA